jgi:SAP domain-containing new25
MTPYGDRRRSGEYDVGSVKTRKQDTVHDPATGGTTVQEAEIDPDEVTLAELKEQAEAKGLPTYGTKAQLAERIAEAG